MSRPFPARHQPRPDRTVAVARIEPSTRVLAPGSARALWVQGCAQRCSGCLVPESHSFSGGLHVQPEELAALLLEGPEVDGLVISGGEPLLQPRGLLPALRAVRAARPGWLLTAFTGYHLDALRARGTAEQRALIGELDVLVDGPYVARLAGSFRFRGSSNQRLNGLTTRGAEALTGLPDVSAGLEVSVDAAGRLAWTGVPPEGFRPALEDAFDLLGLFAEHRTTTTTDPKRSTPA